MVAYSLLAEGRPGSAGGTRLESLAGAGRLGTNLGAALLLVAADRAAFSRPLACEPMFVLAILSERVEKLEAKLDTLDWRVAGPEGNRGNAGVAGYDGELVPVVVLLVCRRGGGNIAPVLACVGTLWG